MISIDKDVLNDDEEAVGSCEGYVVNTKEVNWKNFLNNMLSSQKAVEFVISKIEEQPECEIAILKNINVYDEFRGQGYGNELMDTFLEEASNHGASIFMLVADKNEAQNDGFDLKKWYEDFGFEEVLDESDVTLMVWDTINVLELNGKSLKEQLAEHLTASANKIKLK